MKAFKGIGSQLVLSFAVAVCVAIILVSLGSIRITKTSINANTEVTSEQTLDNVQEGFTTYLKTLSQPVDLLTRKNEIKHLEDQGELDDNVKAMKWNEFGSTIIRPLAASLMRTNSPAGTIYVAMALKTRMTAMIIIGLGTETFLFWTGFAAC